MKKNIILSLSFLLATFSNITTMKAQNEDYTKMIEYATKAPSGHNTQPWLFKIEENKILLLPNFNKALPVVDSHNRELFISLGCALENLCIAANEMNYQPNVDISSEGSITINLKKQDYLDKNTLFNYIEKRQTNRSVYDGRIISDTIIQKFNSLTSDTDIRFYIWEKNTPIFDTLKTYIVNGNTIQMSDKTFKDELKSWMRFNKKQAESTNDGLSYAVFGAPNLPSFILKPIISSFLNPKTQNKGDIKKVESSSHLVLFTTKDNSIDQWINLGRTLQRFLLTSSQENIAIAYMNQPMEVAVLASELQTVLPINNEYPTILLRIGYTSPTTYSRRKSVEEVIITE